MKNLDIIIEKCLSDKPEERYQSMEEIFADIQKYHLKPIQRENKLINMKNDYNEIEHNELGLGDTIDVV